MNDWAAEKWNGKRGIDALKDDFEIDDGDLEDVQILLASYTYENHEGAAFVLFRKDGNLYEVRGGHCSCYGLEGQWYPEETSIEALEKFIENSSRYDFDGCAKELSEVIQALKEQEK